jgi:sugar-specific transcriptional regulator TrmB
MFVIKNMITKLQNLNICAFLSIKMYEDVMHELGFTKNEAKVYLSLLQLGSTTTGAVVRDTGLHRVIIYDVLQSLIKKGFVSYVKREKWKYFHAADPDELLDLLEERKRNVEKILPELHKMKESGAEDVKVEVYRGKEGLKTVLNDVLEEGKDYYILGYTGAARDMVPHWFAHWHKRRRKMKVRRTVIFPNSMRGSGVTRYPLTTRRFLPKGHFTPASTLIYGKDKVLVFLPLTNDFMGIIIKSREVWESYKSEFDLIWKGLPES